MSPNADSARVAIYYAPAPDSVLAGFARWWFAGDGGPAISGINPERLKAMQQSARHYGFHATMKAPFTLAEGCSEAELQQALAAFAGARVSFAAPSLTPVALGPYLVLRPDGRSEELDALAADCVEHFEPFRAPLGAADLERRRKSELSQRQEELLAKWGYPYVMEEFRFHMTLAGPLQPTEHDLLIEQLQAPTAALRQSPFTVDGLALFVQPDRQSPFVQRVRHDFGG